MGKTRDYIAGPDDADRRLDRVLRILLGELPLSAVYAALRQKRILVNGKRSLPAYRVAEGDRISVALDLAERKDPSQAANGDGREGRQDRPRSAFLPDSLVILKTREILFLNKPAGLATHGSSSLDLMVKKAFQDLKEASLSFSPAPLHRLDRNTSGIVAFSLSTRGAQAFTALLREKKIRKTYLALLKGELGAACRWEDLLQRDEESLTSRVSSGADGGELARTLALPLLRSGDSTLALVRIETGRTHQIRVQCSAHGYPLKGDSKYGGGSWEGGYFLHAWLLDFEEKPFEDIPLRIEAGLPEERMRQLAELFGAEALRRAFEKAKKMAKGE